jgi:hypothetical protein
MLVDQALEQTDRAGLVLKDRKVTAIASNDMKAELLVEPKGEVGRFRFPPMVVAEVEIRGGLDLELRALHWLYGTWLPRSRYVPDDHPCFEAWIGRPFAHGTERFELHVQLPIRPVDL